MCIHSFSFLFPPQPGIQSVQIHYYLKHSAYTQFQRVVTDVHSFLFPLFFPPTRHSICADSLLFAAQCIKLHIHNCSELLQMCIHSFSSLFPPTRHSVCADSLLSEAQCATQRLPPSFQDDEARSDGKTRCRFRFARRRNSRFRQRRYGKENGR